MWFDGVTEIRTGSNNMGWTREETIEFGNRILGPQMT